MDDVELEKTVWASVMSIAKAVVLKKKKKKKICFNNKASEEYDPINAPQGLQLLPQISNRIQWHIVIQRSGLAGYTMQLCTILLDLTFRTGFTNHSPYTFTIL
jgi:hypothetical protein